MPLLEAHGSLRIRAFAHATLGAALLAGATADSLPKGHSNR